MAVRVALLGFWHVHAKDYAAQAAAHPDVEIVAVWDEDAGRGKDWAARLGVEFHPELGDLLARDDVDAVVVTCPTADHPSVLRAAARAGKHIFTEKVLTLDVAQCAEVLREVEAAGVVLVVALPRLTDPYTRMIRAVLDSGRLGRLATVRVRLAHGGAVGEAWLPDHFYDPRACGGGALIDLGCHPMYLARLFLGDLPDTVNATFGQVSGRAVEDNAVVTLHYPSGALGVVEAGFVTPHSPFTIEIHGTDGSLWYADAEPVVRWRTDAAPGRSAGWVEEPLPEPGERPLAQFVRHIRDGTRATENVAAAADLTRLMAAAYDSARAGRPVAPDNPNATHNQGGAAA